MIVSNLRFSIFADLKTSLEPSLIVPDFTISVYRAFLSFSASFYRLLFLCFLLSLPVLGMPSNRKMKNWRELAVKKRELYELPYTEIVK